MSASSPLSAPLPLQHLEDFSQPWVQAILNDPSWEPQDLWDCYSPARRPPPLKDICAFFAETLRTDDSIRAALAFHRYPSNPNTHIGNETRMLFSLGTGVNGHEGHSHGGFIGLMMDELTGQSAKLLFGGGIATGEMSIRFQKMLPTPSVVLCRAWIEKEPTERKIWFRASVEDGLGVVFATSECLYIRMRQKL